MNNRSNQLDKLMGMGERSTRKSYYPELQKKIRALERFNMIMDCSHDIILMAECPSGVIVDCNQTACQKLEYVRSNLLGMHVKQLFSSKIRDVACKVGRADIKGASEVVGEMFMSTHDSLPVEVAVQQICYEKQTYVVLVGKDISKRVQAQKDKKRLEQQLLQSQKMEVIGTFAGGIAHDFNNLLQIVSGNIQMLSRKVSGNEDFTRHIRAVEQASIKASKLVKRLLTISRKVDSSKEILDLNFLIRETIDLSERIIPRMIAIELDLNPQIPPVLADPVQLEQIILNLASNAFDALGQGGVITLRTNVVNFSKDEVRHYQELEPGKYVQFTFSDNGCGIPRNIKNKIFDPFFTTKEVGKGTGLGLSTVYAIIKEHGGYITCYSSPVQGTSFKMYFPVVSSGGMAGRKKRVDSEPSDRLLANTCVLVIDDETVIAELSKEMLEEVGSRVLVAHSGEQGIALFEKKSDTIDLVLLDLGMPGMGGEKCLQELRRIDPGGIYVVASGYLGHDIAKNPHAYGAAAFLEKPFRSGGLLTTLTRLLGKNNGGELKG